MGRVPVPIFPTRQTPPAKAEANSRAGGSEDGCYSPLMEPSRPPSLDGARLRLARAGTHLEALADLHDEVCDSWGERLEEGLPDRLPAETFFDDFARLVPRPDIPPNVAILTGEVVYNLRAALDYAVGQTSALQTPEWKRRRPRRNQFPIETTPEGFRSRRDTFLAGVHDGVVHYIEGKQPYFNCDWTRRLAEISNLDKHNELVAVLQALSIEMDDSAAKAARPADGSKPIINATVFTMLRIEDRNERKRDLLDELREIEFSVDQVLRMFEVELFNPKPSLYPGIRFPGEF